MASLVNNPEIGFFDEPTTVLDLLARRHLWDLVADINKRGKTVILTTHYMENVFCKQRHLGLVISITAMPS
jgi:ABC-2 type transport system ATP-binding protein